MTEQMTDERFDVIGTNVRTSGMCTGIDWAAIGAELWDALKAERAKVAELEWEGRPVLELVERITELEAQVAKSEAALKSLLKACTETSAQAQVRSAEREKELMQYRAYYNFENWEKKLPPGLLIERLEAEVDRLKRKVQND